MSANNIKYRFITIVCDKFEKTLNSSSRDLSENVFLENLLVRYQPSASGADSAGSLSARRTIRHSILLAMLLEGFFCEELLMHCLFCGT